MPWGHHFSGEDAGQGGGGHGKGALDVHGGRGVRGGHGPRAGRRRGAVLPRRKALTGPQEVPAKAGFEVLREALMGVQDGVDFGHACAVPAVELLRL